jgi:phytanoyl-CoA hydroxylase
MSDNIIAAAHRAAEDITEIGYAVVRSLFSPPDIDEIRTYYDEIARIGEPVIDHWRPDLSAEEGLPGRYPRFDMAHEVSEAVKRYILHPRLRFILQTLMADDPVAIWNVFYFKPPGTKGFRLHQDDHWNKVTPDPGVAAWIAIDDTDIDNGTIVVVPRTHMMELICPKNDETGAFASATYVDVPSGFEMIFVPLNSGDAVFFNGRLIHGSGHNVTRSKWRRVLVSWYMKKSSTRVGKKTRVVDFEGKLLEYERVDGGAPCVDAV